MARILLPTLSIVLVRSPGFFATNRRGDKWHSFLRNADGSVTTFSVSFRTSGATINRGGLIAGEYYSDTTHFNGFARASDGTVTKFNPSGSVGTSPESVNDSGSIAGWFFDSKYAEHGFVRIP